jgi:hypothetical protein
MARWELAPRLAAKYPWLRVDGSTIDEFRAPFDWGRASSSSSCSSCSSAGSVGIRKEEKERSRGVSDRRRGRNAGKKLKKKASKHGKPTGRRATGERGRRRPQRMGTPTVASHNQDTPHKEETPATRLPPASRDAVSTACGQGLVPPRDAESKYLAIDSPAWLSVQADFEAAVKPKKKQKQHKTGKTRLQALSLQYVITHYAVMQSLTD